MSQSSEKCILVTGSAGAVGRPVCQALTARGHRVRGLDRQPTPDVAQSIVADLTQADAIAHAAGDVDAIIHLAAMAHDAPFVDVLVPSNVVGLFNVMDAARKANVKRVVLASSIQTISGAELGEHVLTARDEAPTNHYALTKVWAERMGDMYARCFDMTVLAVRLGWLARNHREADRLAESQRGKDHYLSHSDAGRFFTAAVETPFQGFHTLYALSQPARQAMADLETARRLIGYEPRDTWPHGLNFDWP